MLELRETKTPNGAAGTSLTTKKSTIRSLLEWYVDSIKISFGIVYEAMKSRIKSLRNRFSTSA